ncbi:hypothetical protein [Caldiplasma sukawensis]
MRYLFDPWTLLKVLMNKSEMIESYTEDFVIPENYSVEISSIISNLSAGVEDIRDKEKLLSFYVKLLSFLEEYDEIKLNKELKETALNLAVTYSAKFYDAVLCVFCRENGCTLITIREDLEKLAKIISVKVSRITME